MRLPVLIVFHRQHLVVDHEQVLGVVFLGGFCEIERAGDDGFAVDDDDFVVGNRVLGVDQGGDAGMRDEVSLGVVLAPLAPVQDRLDLHAALFRIDEGFRDGGRGE